MASGGSRPRLRGTIDLVGGTVEMSHGAGGRAMADLIDAVFRPHLANPLLDQAMTRHCFRSTPAAWS